MDIWGKTDIGTVRRENQDACYYRQFDKNDSALMLICDGMGGAKAGNVASNIAMQKFIDGFSDVQPHKLKIDEKIEIIERLISEANETIYEKSALDDYKGMGTTIVLALIADRECIIANVGDSRAYKISGKSMVQISNDHSVVQDMVNSGDITASEAKRHPNKNLITRALGTCENVKCDIFFPGIKTGDYILLCSDGLSNIVEDNEIWREVASGRDCKTICENLINTAISRGAPDNVTLILLKK